MSDNKFGTTGAGTMNDTLEFVRNFWGSMKVPGMTMPSMSPDDEHEYVAWHDTNVGSTKRYADGAAVYE